MYQETINQRVAKCRILAGLKQIEVAEKMGMKTSTYSQMERKGNISADRIIKLAEIFNIHPNMLLYGFETPKPIEPDNKNIFEPEMKKPETLQQPTVGDMPDFVLPPMVLTKCEENIIKIIRQLPPNTKKAVIEYIDKCYKENKKKI